jgi:hypothetical protein
MADTEPAHDLALAAVPAPALAWDGGHGGGHEVRGGHERFEPHRSSCGAGGPA